MFRTLFICCLLVFCSSAFSLEIFLFRHAEKQAGQDPELTLQGKARAERLAELIAPLQPTLLFSTDYLRTTQTIAPLAKVVNLPVQIYNPKNLNNFAKALSAMSGTVVVVGHSNTTPALLKALTGINKTIPESQFDVIYWLKKSPDGFSVVETSSDLQALP
ncbi:SixA phosphatase family protein [Pseudoalteromonas fenneropenaei]|uniref:SixA phosphatase family protein n=1 Tax=Pseudoalteromonas fenneropenaei TaxID=1737459 RepID=A0ABV7CG92_9GAMM